MNNSSAPISMTEHLSALLDNEAGSFEQRRVLDELKSAKDLCQKLSSYALIGETMRSADRDKPVLALGASFLQGIHDKIEAEDEYNHVHVAEHALAKASQNNSKPWLRPIGGFALAASVAAVAVIGLQNYQQSDSAEIVAASGQPANTTQKTQLTESEMNNAVAVPADTIIAADSEQYMQADTQTRSLLKRYVDSHMQYASTATFVPSVRTIAYIDNQ